MTERTQNAPASMYRSREGLGVWEHRGKVAVVGIGHSPADRRWDGVNMDKALGAYAINAAEKCLKDAGVRPEQIDGVVAVPTGLGDAWAPRPYLAPPYDSEDGLTGVSADWLVKNMAGLKNVTFTMHGSGCISNAMNVAAQAIGDGLAHTVLVLRATGNLPGRYHQAGSATEASVPGGAVGADTWQTAWESVWGWDPGPQLFAIVFDEYCRRYNTNHDRMAPFVVNLRRNGLMMPEGFYAQNRSEPFNVEDYLNGRWISKPLSIYDCDMPIQTVACYLMTTAERARDMKQKPVYVLGHATHQAKPRCIQPTLEETEASTDSLARKLYEASGLTYRDVDVFNPYDGFALFTQHYVESFRWHGVMKGEAHDLYASDIRVEGPYPLLSSGGNIGNGRTRFWHYTDSIQQLQGRAGKRQVKIKAETAIAGGPTPLSGNWMAFGTSPD